MSETKEKKIINEIGRTVYVLRLKVGKSREDIATGLCSLSVMQRLENGERYADKLLIDALIQRLGKSPDKFEFVLVKDEYEINQKRIAICRSFEAEEYEKCRELLKNFERGLKEKDTLNRQFVQKIRFLLDDFEYESLEEAEDIILNMISLTSPGFRLEEMQEKYLCIEECKLIYMLALTDMDGGEYGKAAKILTELLDYHEMHFSDIEERIKLYPQISCSLAECLEREEEYLREMEVAQRAIDLVEDNGRIFLLAELLTYYKNGLERNAVKAGRELTAEEAAKQKELKCQIEVLYEIQEEFGEGKKPLRGKNTISHNYGGQEVQLVNEVLNRKRKIMGLTQEELSRGICEPETLSKVLNGRKPHQRTYQKLAECLEMDSERCRPYLTSDDYEVYEMQREIENTIHKMEYDKAEKIFEKVESYLNQEDAKNKQYCLRTRCLIEKNLGRMECQDAVKILEEAIKCTIPSYGENSLVKYILSRQEIILLNNIANNYAYIDQVDKAIIIYDEIVKSYKNSSVDMLNHIESVILTMYNYEKWLGVTKNYEEAILVIKDTILLNLKTGRGKYLGALLYGLAWNLWQMDKENKKACYKYCKQACNITGLMKEYKIQCIVKDNILQNFGYIVD